MPSHQRIRGRKTTVEWNYPNTHCVCVTEDSWAKARESQGLPDLEIIVLWTYCVLGTWPWILNTLAPSILKQLCKEGVHVATSEADYSIYSCYLICWVLFDRYLILTQMNPGGPAYLPHYPVIQVAWAGGLLNSTYFLALWAIWSLVLVLPL